GAGRAFLPWLLWALLLPAVVYLLRRVPVVCAIASVEHRCLSGKCRGAEAHRRTDSFRVAPGAYGGAWGLRILPRRADGLVGSEPRRVIAGASGEVPDERRECTGAAGGERR